MADSETTVVVSTTLSVASMATALASLFRVGRWIGTHDARADAHTASLEQFRRDQTARLEEIREDVREIRGLLLSTPHPRNTP